MPSFPAKAKAKTSSYKDKALGFKATADARVKKIWP